MSNWQDKLSAPKTTGTVFAPEDEPPSVIMLVTGEDTEGRGQWAYAKVPAQNYTAFKKAEMQGNYSLQDFGEILKSGAGNSPPEAIRQAMQEQYGCDENFEDSLAKMIEDAIEAWNEALKEEDNS